MRDAVRGTVAVLAVLLLALGYFSFGGNGVQDTFHGVLVEGRPLNSTNAVVLADTNCTPDQTGTRLTCTAIIDAQGEILKVRYTHPVEVPCLARGDKVNILMNSTSSVEIVRLGAPSMEH
ncbi:hypothetical protein [Thermococcus thioreducens]|uniref:Uncharacterized protein n=1 Tax=Thermococcus thioreducens TaxID=277988 RepID=A0A0Q2M2V7_9EURY|nr:hypothetical protein [Thermococcus thioreducens]ASJ12640.1 hypothetical protein A3L14_06965 [Thermococcus thioreducens]KQH82369.1 hypothetical protein AMR53_05280 [Thermococcus thioreducens]SEV87400.1 hypothetical protein SAMN05216170_0554 [Thermococcus thioreducens]